MALVSHLMQAVAASTLAMDAMVYTLALGSMRISNLAPVHRLERQMARSIVEMIDNWMPVSAYRDSRCVLDSTERSIPSVDKCSSGEACIHSTEFPAA